MKIASLLALALAASFSITFAVSAAEWKQVAPNGFLDMESIVRAGPAVQIWRKVIYKDGVEMPSIVGRRKFETLLILVEFNCERRTYQTVEALGFLGPISSDIGLTLELPKAIEHVRPESFIEREMKLACAAK